MFPKPVHVERKKKPLRSRRHAKAHYNKDGHEFLYGVDAHAKRRIEIFEQAGGKVFIERDGEGKVERVSTERPAVCQACETGHPVSFEDGHWIHTQKRHCDCLNCGIYGCKPGHSANFHHGRELL